MSLDDDDGGVGAASLPVVRPWLPLQSSLMDVFRRQQPTPEDKQMRQDLLSRLHGLFSRDSGYKWEVSVFPFGSFESNLYSPWADLDLSLQVISESSDILSARRRKDILFDAYRTLRRSQATSRLEIISHSRIPLVKFKDYFTGISCDLSVANDGGVLKSTILGWISNIDDRCRQLIFLVKCWAKAQEINDPKDGSLNSFAICQLVIFHLQNVNPPIIPPLEEILGDQQLDSDLLSNTSRKERFSLACNERISQIKQEGHSIRNRDILAMLFATFFRRYDQLLDKWSEEDLAVSTWSGRLKSCRDSEWYNSQRIFSIEDPFDFAQNCGRSVQLHKVGKIMDCISKAALILSSPPTPPAISSLRAEMFKWPARQACPTGVKIPKWRTRRVESCLVHKSSSKRQQQAS